MGEKTGCLLDGKWIPLRWERSNEHGSWSLESNLLPEKLLWDFVPVEREGNQFVGKLIRVDGTNCRTNHYIFSADRQQLRILDRSETGEDDFYRVAVRDNERVFLHAAGPSEHRLVLQKIVPLT